MRDAISKKFTEVEYGDKMQKVVKVRNNSLNNKIFMSVNKYNTRVIMQMIESHQKYIHIVEEKYGLGKWTDKESS